MNKIVKSGQLLNIHNNIRKSSSYRMFFCIALIFVLVSTLINNTFSFYSIGNNAYAQSPYQSGYSHGCSDAKISNSDDQYINQPGRGPSYHTSEFMNGYYNGFDDCARYNNSPQSNHGVFKIIVEVTNHHYRDAYGGITVSIDHYPHNLFKSAYDIYFPAGETIFKTFSFDSYDVPVGTQFEVNVDYGDDYNQYKFGENSPANQAEIIHFDIP